MKLGISIIFVITTVYICESRPQVDLSWLDKMLADINRNVEQTQRNIDRTVQQQLAKVDEIIANAKSLPANTNGQTVIVNSGVGTSVIAGTGSDGKPYRQEIEDRVVNNVQYRTIWNYNSTTNKMDVFQWTRNLNDPTAPFVQVKPSQQN